MGACISGPLGLWYEMHTATAHHEGTRPGGTLASHLGAYSKKSSSISTILIVRLTWTPTP